MDVLLLRFDAPLMSFGGVMVDHHGPTERFPGLSLLAGLFANALGYSHGEADKLEVLQDRIEYAARWDVEPEALVDYHTVDLGQPKMCEPGWTTRGEPEHRDGGSAKTATHIRLRHYWANGIMTVAVVLKDDNDRSHAPRFPDRSHAPRGNVSFTVPRSGTDNGAEHLGLHSHAERGNDNNALTLQDLAHALNEPARPLFLGRKTCLPSSPLFIGIMEADHVLAALRQHPRAERIQKTSRKQEPKPMPACWPVHLGETRQSRQVPIYDRRDWRNQIHAGRRIRIEGLLEPTP